MTETTQTGIPIEDCPTCGHRHPVTRVHCAGCGRASVFMCEGLCLACSKCPECGHKAVDHHGTDSRSLPHAGCMAISAMRDDWCRCAQVATYTETPMDKQGVLEWSA